MGDRGEGEGGGREGEREGERERERGGSNQPRGGSLAEVEDGERQGLDDAMGRRGDGDGDGDDGRVAAEARVRATTTRKGEEPGEERGGIARETWTPSRVMREADALLDALEEMEARMREAFTELVGARMGLAGRRMGLGSAALRPVTWPLAEEARVGVGVDGEGRRVVLVRNASEKGEDETALRAWCGGAKPPPEAKRAKEGFVRVLEMALAVADRMDEVRRQDASLKRLA